MAVYESKPPDARHAVVVFHEGFGMTEHIKQVADRFSAVGYHTVVPDLYHRLGSGSVFPYGETVRDVRLVSEDVRDAMSTLTDEYMLDDLDAILDHFGWSATAGVGFCLGGRTAFLAALRRELAASVTFYGQLVTSRVPHWPSLAPEAPDLATPWLGLFGDQDHAIPVEDVEVIRSALRSARSPHEIVRYPHARHGFFCDQRSGYNPADAEDAWERTVAWLATHLDR